MGTPYFIIERGVYDHLNALKSDSVANAQSTLISGSALVADTQILNPMYPQLRVWRQILLFERIIGKAICNTEGHARRKDFVSVQKLNHLDALPSAVGGFGSVWDTEGGSPTLKYLLPRTPEIVIELRDTANQIPVQNGTFAEEFAFGYDGARFYHTLSRQVSAEVFTFASMPDTFAGIATLFNPATSPVPSSFLPDEFTAALEYGAAGICAMKVGTFPEESNSLLQLAQMLMQELGVTFKIPLDFAATASPVQ